MGLRTFNYNPAANAPQTLVENMPQASNLRPWESVPWDAPWAKRLCGLRQGEPAK